MVSWLIRTEQERFRLLAGDFLLVGKDQECDLVLRDPLVSRRHLRFFQREQSLFLEDLGSTNGTKVDGLACVPGRSQGLVAGNEVVLGNSKLIIEYQLELETEQATEHSSAVSAPNGNLGAWLNQALEYTYSHADGSLQRGSFREKLRELTGLSDADISKLEAEVFDLAPISSLLADPQVTEILINGKTDIWFEREGRLSRHTECFQANESLLHFVRRELVAMGRKIDQRTPFVDARLANGTRLCAVIPPAVIGDLHITLRKFPVRWPSISELESFGTFSSEARRYLEEAIGARKNILICGATGSGKSTLLNALASAVPVFERILTLEDTAELRIDHPHVVRFESRPPNLEGEGEINLRTLLRVGLRMRPDRIVVGEVRGNEALELLQALNTGHAGSLASIHANSCREALSRLELLASLASGDAVRAETLRGYIAACVGLVINVSRTPAGRQITEIKEVAGIDEGQMLLRTVEFKPMQTQKRFDCA